MDNGSGNVALPFLGAMPLVIFFGVCCGFFLLGWAVMLFNCLFLRSCLNRIPPAHRLQSPNLVFLLLIPLFNLVWGFFVYPRIAESFKRYFSSIGRTDVGDCGQSLALALCIMCCLLLIPYLNLCCSIAVLIVWILLLVRFSGLKAQIPPGAA